MAGLQKGRYAARFAQSASDIEAAAKLRDSIFRDGAGSDGDRFDAEFRHVVIEDTQDGAIVCSFRLLHVEDGSRIGQSYSAQYYELSGLQDFSGSMVEMGRFCIDPARRDPDILRIAWGFLTQYVDSAGVEMLFGCASFAGVEATAYADAFALLKDKHLAPQKFTPKVKAPAVYRFAKALRLRKPNLKQALQSMPPLLRSYLTMGGWVSDHAVVDRDLNTLHVFTGLEINAIPEGRKRLLQAVIG